MNPHDEQRLGRVTLVGLIIAIFGVAFMFGGHPVISALLLLLAWVLIPPLVVSVISADGCGRSAVIEIVAERATMQ
jgi:multisubunit Na+/H+ antiporter MnhG subunit